MRVILEALRDGDHSIVDTFVGVNKLWPGILEDIDQISVADLAERLGGEQSAFEREAGDRNLGKMLFGWSGYTHLYSIADGFDENAPKATKLRDAFANSHCSVEVKGASETAAKLYHLD
jgi:hypothetical protein